MTKLSEPQQRALLAFGVGRRTGPYRRFGYLPREARAPSGERISARTLVVLLREQLIWCDARGDYNFTADGERVYFELALRRVPGKRGSHE